MSADQSGRVRARSPKDWRTNSRIVVLVERTLPWRWPWRYFVVLDGDRAHAAVLTGLALSRDRAQQEAERRAQRIAQGCVWGWPDV